MAKRSELRGSRAAYEGRVLGGIGSEARFKGGAGRQVTGDRYARTLCGSKKISNIGTSQDQADRPKGNQQ